MLLAAALAACSGQAPDPEPADSSLPAVPGVVVPPAQGLTGWTMRDLATSVGIRAPSLYAHFGSKHEIYDAMFVRPAKRVSWALWRIVDAFYDRVERDDLLSPFFPGGVSAEHRAHVTTWWIEVFGGTATDRAVLEATFPGEVAKVRSGGGGAVVAYLDDRPVGSGGLTVAGPDARLWGGVVLPEARGRGIYRAVLAARLAYAGQAGADVDPRARRDARGARSIPGGRASAAAVDCGRQ